MSDASTPTISPVVVEGTAVVWKFAIPMPDADGRSFVEIPWESELLSVSLQDDRHRHRLIVANTGMSITEFPSTARFLGTVTTSNGIVWHIWDGDA